MLAAVILALYTFCSVSLVCAIRYIRFGHAVCLCCALCISSGGVCRVQAQKPGASVMIISVHGAGEQQGIAVCGLCAYGRGVSGDFRDPSQ